MHYINNTCWALMPAFLISRADNRLMNRKRQILLMWQASLSKHSSSDAKIGSWHFSLIILSLDFVYAFTSLCPCFHHAHWYIFIMCDRQGLQRKLVFLLFCLTGVHACMSNHSKVTLSFLFDSLPRTEDAQYVSFIIALIRLNMFNAYKKAEIRHTCSTTCICCHICKIQSLIGRASTFQIILMIGVNLAWTCLHQKH